MFSISCVLFVSLLSVSFSAACTIDYDRFDFYGCKPYEFFDPANYIFVQKHGMPHILNYKGDVGSYIDSIDSINNTVDTVFYNDLDRNLMFECCSTSFSNITSDIYPILYAGGNQELYYQGYPGAWMITGHCYYSVVFDNKLRILDKLYYRNVLSGHEFYGMTACSHYNVWIEIFSSGVVKYIIWN